MFIANKIIHLYVKTFGSATYWNINGLTCLVKCQCQYVFVFILHR